MFRSLMTIIRELYLYLTKVIFVLKHTVKLRRYKNWAMWHHAGHITQFISGYVMKFYFVLFPYRLF